MIYLVPYAADTVGVFDPSTNVFTTVNISMFVLGASKRRLSLQKRPVYSQKRDIHTHSSTHIHTYSLSLFVLTHTHTHIHTHMTCAVKLS